MHPNSQKSIHVVIVIAFRKNPILPQKEERDKTLTSFGQQYNIICHIIFIIEEKRTNTLQGQVDRCTCTKFEAKCELLQKVHVLFIQHRCKNRKKAQHNTKISCNIRKIYGASNKYYAIVFQTSMSNLHEYLHCLIFHKQKTMSM